MTYFLFLKYPNTFCAVTCCRLWAPMVKLEDQSDKD